MPETIKWWNEHNPEHVKMVPKWKYVREVYEADPSVLRKEDAYILQKKQGEHRDNYAERIKLAKVLPMLGTVVESYVGRVSGARVVRRWNRPMETNGVRSEENGLGHPDDTETIAGRMWTDADGRGTNYEPVLSKVATGFVLYNHQWAIAEGYTWADEGRNIVTSWPHVRLVAPEDVPITIEDEHGRLVAAVVRHTKNMRGDVFAKAESETRYTVYTLDGHATFRITDKDEAERTDGGKGFDEIPYFPAGGAFYATAEANAFDRILPVFRVDLPAKRYPAFTLATLNVVHMNHTSELQNKHRQCNILRLQLVATDGENFKAQKEAIAEGGSVLMVPADSSRDNKYIEPDATSLRETREWLDAGVMEFMMAALREYENSTRGAQRTATEAAQDAAQGEHSYLNTLAGALDEFETQLWKRLEQIEWPNEPKRWGQFSVARKRNFRPLDEEGEAMRLRSTFFGSERIPVGPKGRASVAKRIAEIEDVEYEDSEIEAEVRSGDQRAAQFGDLNAELGL